MDPGEEPLGCLRENPIVIQSIMIDSSSSIGSCADKACGDAAASTSVSEQGYEDLISACDTKITQPDDAKFIKVRHDTTGELKPFSRKRSYEEFLKAVSSVFVSQPKKFEGKWLVEVRGQDRIRITRGNYESIMDRYEESTSIYFVETLSSSPTKALIDSALRRSEILYYKDLGDDSSVVRGCKFCGKESKDKEDMVTGYFLEWKHLRALAKSEQRALMRYCGLMNLHDRANRLRLCRDCHAHYVANDIGFRVRDSYCVKRIVRDTIFDNSVSWITGATYGHYHGAALNYCDDISTTYNLFEHRMKQYDEKTARLKEVSGAN